MRLTRCCSIANNCGQNSAAGFSFTDLLTVLGMLVLLVLLQLPALAHNKAIPIALSAQTICGAWPFPG